MADLDDLRALGYLPKFEPNIPKQGTGAYIKLRYQELWEQINVEELITPDENYRIQERVRALNELGFSVGDIELEEGENGSQLRLAGRCYRSELPPRPVKESFRLGGGRTPGSDHDE